MVGASKVRVTALDGFEAEKCAPRSLGALKPLGGRQPVPPPEHGERGGSVGLGGGIEGGGGEGAPIVTNAATP